jgi:hypothetical protein
MGLQERRRQQRTVVEKELPERDATLLVEGLLGPRATGGPGRKERRVGGARSTMFRSLSASWSRGPASRRTAKLTPATPM